MLTARQRRKIRAKTVGTLLFLLPLPLLLKTVFSLWLDNPGAFAAAGASWLLFLGAAMLCRRGLQGELMEEDRLFVSRRTAMLKTGGGVLTGLATAMTAFLAVGHSLPIALAFGLTAALGYFLLYGDLGGRAAAAGAVRREPGAGDDAEVAGLLRDAYRRLDAIGSSSRRITSPEFRRRLDNIVVSAEKVVKLVADDPRDLRRARKFLTVYLDGAQRITEDYARTHGAAASPDLEHNFRTLLVDMENTCDEQYQKLLAHDVSDLEVQIEVLSARLRREGVV